VGLTNKFDFKNFVFEIELKTKKINLNRDFLVSLTFVAEKRPKGCQPKKGWQPVPHSPQYSW
jgi:hypothetical protein